ncbi:MAG: glycosyltransferase, partial [Candidatus Peribacteraceae bacterium]|nr:glycosyltransferase [Candidatus Peribacteraceae bacterium]
VGWPIAASFSEKLFRPLSRIFLPKESKAASAVRTVNSSVLSTLKDFGIPEEKIELLPSFYLDSKILVQKNEIKKDFDLVFAGRLVVNKGLDRLLAAIETLPSIRLLVIGDGPQRKYEEAHAKRLNIADRVVFVGWQSTQEEVMNAIQRAKIFVLPSKSEGGPRVALEAMACGMPVLTTPVGVMQDTIRNGENGLLTTGEPEDIAEKISLLLSDEDWCKKIGNEAKNILNEFNKEALVRKYAEFLQSLVHNNQTML